MSPLAKGCAYIGYFRGSGSGHGICVGIAGEGGERLTSGKVWGGYIPVAEFPLGIADIRSAIAVLQRIAEKIDQVHINP